MNNQELKQQHEQLLAKIPDGNPEWVAQQLLQMPAKDRHIVLHALRKLDKALYKSWAKDMPFCEIMEAVKMISKEPSFLSAFKSVTPPAESPAYYTMQKDPNAPQANQEQANEQATQESAELNQEAQEETKPEGDGALVD